MARTKKPKPSFMGCYDRDDRQYKPEVEGYGNPDQWRGAFAKRMSLEDAEVIIGDGSPWSVLGIRQGASDEQIRKAYKQKALEFHPSSARNAGKDQAVLEKAFKKVVAAYTMLTGGH